MGANVMLHHYRWSGSIKGADDACGVTARAARRSGHLVTVLLYVGPRFRTTANKLLANYWGKGKMHIHVTYREQFAPD
jgi:hypothetical protein